MILEGDNSSGVVVEIMGSRQRNLEQRERATSRLDRRMCSGSCVGGGWKMYLRIGISGELRMRVRNLVVSGRRRRRSRSGSSDVFKLPKNSFLSWDLSPPFSWNSKIHTKTRCT